MPELRWLRSYFFMTAALFVAAVRPVQQVMAQGAITLSTQAVAAGNVLQGTDAHLFYIIKLDVTDAAAVTINSLTINTTGNYTTDDISAFTLYRNSTPSVTGASFLAQDPTVTGAGETLTFNTGGVGYSAGTTYYLLIRANIRPGATAGRNFKIDGSANGAVFTFVNTTPGVTNNQTDAAGLQTIFRPEFSFSTQAVAAGNVLQGTDAHLFYIIKLDVTEAAAVTINSLTINTTGNYTTDDISAFTLYRNSTPSVTGASFLAQDPTVTGAGESLTFNTGGVGYSAGTTYYLLIRANVRPGATAGRNFKIDGSANGAAFTFVNTTPGVTDNQTDAAGIQTIGSPMPVILQSFSVQRQEHVRLLTWITTSEAHNDFFEVQRSRNGIAFENLGQVQGIGTTVTAHTYTWTDPEIFPGGVVLYYRLRQVDYDGTYTFSPVISYRVQAGETTEAVVYPNPFQGALTMRFTPGATLTVGWYAIDGRLIIPAEKVLVPASGELAVPGTAVPATITPGVYLLKIGTPEGTVVRRVIRGE